MRILVANRGEIACRIIASIKELGHEAVAVYTDVDAMAPHVRLADHAVALGEARAYLDIPKLIAAMRDSGAEQCTRVTVSCRRAPLSSRRA